MGPAAALAGREIPDNPETWPAYRELVHTVIRSVARLPVVLLGVCTPDELKDWPIDAWALLDCTDQERQRRLDRRADPQHLADAISDAREYRQLGLPVIDTTPAARPQQSRRRWQNSSSRLTRVEVQHTQGECSPRRDPWHRLPDRVLQPPAVSPRVSR
jgi:hypothetical protein